MRCFAAVKYYSEMTVTDDVLLDKDLKRAGVIPYVKINDKVFFIFGLGEGIASISDFGGTKEEKDEDAVDNALREFREESFTVLGTLNRNHLLNSPYIVGETGFHEGEKGVVFLVKYRNEFPFSSKMREFKERNVPGDETRGIIVLSREQLISGLKQPDVRIGSTKPFQFHAKVKNILLSGIDTIGSL